MPVPVPGIEFAHVHMVLVDVLAHAHVRVNLFRKVPVVVLVQVNSIIAVLDKELAVVRSFNNNIGVIEDTNNALLLGL